MSWLALDLGGANLKAADGQGYARSVSFPLWQRREQLPDALAAMIEASPAADSLAVTMTGELADCFATKAEGVEFIIRSVLEVAAGRECFVYAIPGELIPALVAIHGTQRVAASNWHVLGTLAGTFTAESGLLLDIGSTTCDVIPLSAGQPRTVGRTDTSRLLNRELVYTGVERTPICAMVSHVPYRGQMCPVASEWFATSLDVYLLLRDLSEDSQAKHTADGRPATIPHARDRLARVICADNSNFTMEDAKSAAVYIVARQTEQLASAASEVLRRQGTRVNTVVLSGSGEFLGRRVVSALRKQGTLSPETHIVSLRERLGASISECAPAHALAVFAQARRVAG